MAICGCPEGYTPSLDQTTCIRVTSVAATPAQTTYTVVHGNQITAYGVSGANFYDDATLRPLPISAVTGPNALKDASSVTLAVQAHVSNTLWGNGGSPVNGRLNTTGVWTAPAGGSSPVGEWIGFTSCIDIPADGTYAIAIAADNRARFKINGTTVVQLDNGSTFSFGFWHVIPFTLQAGLNIIELEGKNDGSFASFGAEIYNATIAQLQTMTTQVELAAVTVFSTLDQIGLSFQTGENSGYSCPEGYVLSDCDSGLSCVLIERTDFVQCCYLLTNCETNLTMIADNDLSAYLGQVVTLFNIEGCWTIENTDDCTGAIQVAVTASYLSCQSCLPVCYRLVDCSGSTLSIITSTDLAIYVGQVIKLRHCSNICWFVEVSENCIGAVPVIVSELFDTCIDCLPPIPEPPPLELHPRKIKPGYDTPGCPPEYTEKVNCAFSESLYKQVMSERYGIEICCDTDNDKWWIRKQLLDLRAIYDPGMCKSTLNRCCAPTCSKAILDVYNPISCPAPTLTLASIVVEIDCPAPESTSAYLNVILPGPTMITGTR